MAGIVLVVGAGLSYWAARQHAQNNQEEARLAVAETAERLTTEVTSAMQLYQYGLRGARGAILTAGDRLSRELFHQYSRTRDINAEFPGARGFGFIRRVPMADETAFVNQARHDGWPAFDIYQLEAHDGERYVIDYIEPVERNEASIGFDIASEENRRVAAETSMREAKATLTGPITLVQETGERQQSFLLMMPIYRGGIAPATVAEREAATFGWSYAPLSMREVFAHINFDNSAVHLRLRDITDADIDLFYETPGSGQTELLTQRLERDVFGRRWQIELSAYPPFIERLNQFQPTTVLLASLLSTLMMSMLVAALSISRQRKEQVVSEQARLATIVSNSSDAIIGESLDGLIISWNRAAERLFGYGEDEVLGKPLAALLIPPERHSEDTELLLRTARGEDVGSFDTTRLHRDGRLMDLAITAAAMHDAHHNIVGVAKLMHDIRDRKEAERRLTEFNARLEREVVERTTELNRVNVLLSDVLSAASEFSIIATDLTGRCTIFNAGAERMLGYTAAEMVGNFPAIIHRREDLIARGVELSDWYGETITGLRIFSYVAAREGFEKREWIYVRKDGTTLDVSLVITPMRDSSGTISGYLGIAEDITEHKRATEALRIAKVAAEAANTAKGQFLTMMSHELRTPMSGILGMTDLLLTTELAPEQRSLLQTLTRSANTLLDLLNDILDFAKIEAGRIDLEDIDFSPGQLVRDIAAVLGPLASEKGNTIEVNIAPTLRAAYRGDVKRYRQVLTNLIGNANKFTTDGRIDIGLREFTGDDGRLMIETLVADTGIGIAAANREQLFQPFIQEDISTSRKFGGTGLGLAISKNLVELMGGRIWVDSERGKGSTFGFVVTLKPGDATKIEAVGDAGRPAVAAAGHLPSPKRPLSILLAEDNPTNRMLLTALLSRMGHTVAAVENGALAVEAAALGGYDMILMDMQMPVMDGPSAMRAIRSGDAPASTVPIIALTADAMREHHTSYRAAGAGAVVTKPVDWHHLNAEMDRLTGGTAEAVIAEPAPKIPAMLPVLDEATLDTLSASIGGKLLNSLLDTCAANVRVYAAALAAGGADLKEDKRTAHALKGLAAQFGAVRLSEFARQIEEGAKESQDVSTLAPLVAAAADEALEAFAGWRERQRLSA